MSRVISGSELEKTLAKIRAQKSPASESPTKEAPKPLLEEVHKSLPIPPDDNVTDKEFALYLDPQAKYHPLPFSDAVDMLYAIFDPVISGRITPHDWQIEELLRLSSSDVSPTNPIKYLLSAANGSGKDAFIIAVLIIYYALCSVRSRTVVTSASYTQLKLQTEAYVRIMAGQANEKLKAQGVCERAFIIKKEHIVCTLTGAEIVLFVTDDVGRAEGYHPFPDYPDGRVTIIINEAKTVPDFISEALSRCTYSRWIEVSSPGKTSGFHYAHYTMATYYPAPMQRGKYYHRTITSYDCPHIPLSKIEADKIEYGENSAIFRSKHLALFTSLDEQVVINKDMLDRCIQNPPARLKLNFGRRAGLDLAKGGDENALYIWEDNVLIGKEVFRASDTAEVTVPALIDFFRKWGLKAENIYADDGGLGAVIIDNLRKQGWPVNRVVMQSPPIQKGGPYSNRGAELWFRFGRLVEENVLIFHPKEREKELPDDRLYYQLTNRYYKQHEMQGKIGLESKSEARAKGHGSPDRADACVLAFCGISIQDFQGAEKISIPHIPKTLAHEKVIRNMSPLAPKLLEVKEYQRDYIEKLRDEEMKKKRELLSTRNPCGVLKRVYQKFKG